MPVWCRVSYSRIMTVLKFGESINQSGIEENRVAHLGGLCSFSSELSKDIGVDPNAGSALFAYRGTEQKVP